MIEDKTFESNLIRIGTKQIENDEVLNNSKQTDLWFHLADFPSCHLVLSCSSEFPVTKEMITYCANQVKSHTKYKSIPKVSVNYIEVKYVSKTNVPGKVIMKKKPTKIVV